MTMLRKIERIFKVVIPYLSIEYFVRFAHLQGTSSSRLVSVVSNFVDITTKKLDKLTNGVVLYYI